VVADKDGSLPTERSDKSGCLGYVVNASDLGLATMPAGTYQLALLAGPSLDQVGKAFTVRITAPATPGN
jgi:hypothetical protein